MEGRARSQVRAQVDISTARGKGTHHRTVYHHSLDQVQVDQRRDVGGGEGLVKMKRSSSTGGGGGGLLSRIRELRCFSDSHSTGTTSGSQPALSSSYSHSPAPQRSSKLSLQVVNNSAPAEKSRSGGRRKKERAGGYDSGIGSDSDGEFDVSHSYASTYYVLPAAGQKVKVLVSSYYCCLYDHFILTSDDPFW